jgi:O-antigen ligase
MPPIALPASTVQVVASGRKLRRRVLLLVLTCALPAVMLLALGRLTLAAHYFWAVFALVTVALVVKGRHETLLALVIGVSPLVNLLRGFGFAFYTMPLLVFAGMAVYYAVRAPQASATVWRRCPLLVWLVAMAGVYYLFSLALTGEYSRNLRMAEFCLGVYCVLLAGRNRYVVAAGLLGLIVSAGAIGLGLLPHNAAIGRLGIAVIEGNVVGNPVQLGLALALGFLALVVDRGQWLGLGRSRFQKWFWLLPVAALLLLTTSRAAWLVVSGGVILTAVFGQGQRMKLLLVGALVPLVVVVALWSPLGPGLQNKLDRTFRSERDLTGVTSGRSDQWAVAYQAAMTSWDRLLFGYGPGLGPTVYATYSERTDNVRYSVGRAVELHSLFMQLQVEAGLLGLVLFLAWLAVALFWVAVGTWSSGRLLPLVCFCGYVLTIATVSGNDTICGAMLGIGLLGTLRRST